MSLPEPEAKAIKERIAEHENTAEILWGQGSTAYCGVPIKLHPEFKRAFIRRQPFFKDQFPKRQFHKMTDSLCVCIDKSTSLLAAFPGLQIAFEDKTAKFGTTSTEVVVNGAYIATIQSQTIYISSIERPEESVEDVFSHEFGHHIHFYFTPEQHMEFFERQQWYVGDGRYRRVATPSDIISEKYTNKEISTPRWELFDKYGIIRNQYRYVHPHEMVATVVEENWRNLLQFLQLTGESNQTGIIRFILDKIPLVPNSTSEIRT
ncbi:MAG: hypothetical protein M1268_01790 [Patescibacteria group bacterium]|nr:hypothetical protein [Patescibacteria group bacterium]